MILDVINIFFFAVVRHQHRSEYTDDLHRVAGDRKHHQLRAKKPADGGSERADKEQRPE